MMDELHAFTMYILRLRKQSGYVGRTRIFRSAQLLRSATSLLFGAGSAVLISASLEQRLGTYWQHASIWRK